MPKQNDALAFTAFLALIIIFLRGLAASTK